MNSTLTHFISVPGVDVSCSDISMRLFKAVQLDISIKLLAAAVPGSGTAIFPSYPGRHVRQSLSFTRWARSLQLPQSEFFSSHLNGMQMCVPVFSLYPGSQVKQEPFVEDRWVCGRHLPHSSGHPTATHFLSFKLKPVWHRSKSECEVRFCWGQQRYEVGIYSPALYSHVRLDNMPPHTQCNNIQME